MQQLTQGASFPGKMDQFFLNPFFDPHRLNVDRILTTSSEPFFTTSTRRVYVERIWLINYSGSNAQFTVRWIQPEAGGGTGGGTDDAGDSDIVPGLTISAHDALIVPCKFVLEAGGDEIRAFCSADTTGAILLLGGLER